MDVPVKFHQDSILGSGSCDVPPSTKDEIMALGYPSYDEIYEGYSFIYSFDSELGVSRWVAECLTSEQINTETSSRKYDEIPFYEDKKIVPENRVTLEDYKNSGYTRGHLAAAANHRYNKEAYKGTYCLCNIAPMHRNVNQILGRIEKQARSFAKEYGKVYITTGTVFDEERDPTFLNGCNKLAIPDAFFKVLAYKVKKDKYMILSYLIRNSPDVQHKNIINARVKLGLINCETRLTILRNLNEKEMTDDCYPQTQSSRLWES